ncbi:MAG TPA: lysophospholipid acyltransferase family protein [Candidatus Deferrimicrobiaceae bacterium]|nr:lysophospholipid acyltransferase family protein [Candidatus Deferrimicrobiaceae bacterium]
MRIRDSVTAAEPAATAAANLAPADPRRALRRRPDLERYLVRADLPAWQRALRYRAAQLVVWIYGHLLFRLSLEGAEHVVDGPALYCFNHLGWLDPLAMLAAFPARVRLYFYGPQEQDLRHGAKNRLMWWTGIAVPFSPSKDDLITSVRRAQSVFESGGALAIAGEGRIHVHEGDLLPFQEGAAYLALRARVPIVPVAITGTSWIRFRGEIRIRLGEPIETGPRPTREVVTAYTARLWHVIKAMVTDDHDRPPPGRVERWFSDAFNDWGPGGREAAALVRGPRPEDVPLPPLPSDTAEAVRR